MNGTDLHKLIKQLNIEFVSLCKLFKSNELSLNTETTFYMILHRARLKITDDINHTLIMDNITLTKVSSINYLGVIADHKLNWIDHISHVKNKIYKGIGILYRARRYLNKTSLKIFTMLMFIHISHIVLKYGDLLQNVIKIPYFFSKRRLFECDIIFLSSTYRSYL